MGELEEVEGDNRGRGGWERRHGEGRRKEIKRRGVERTGNVRGKRKDWKRERGRGGGTGKGDKLETKWK